jgi:hypothetical protein
MATFQIKFFLCESERKNKQDGDEDQDLKNRLGKNNIGRN